VGLLFVQLLVGYEWFVSGLTKVVRSGFPGGLAEELREKSTTGSVIFFCPRGCREQYEQELASEAALAAIPR
jgi:hypothetical protein